MSGAVKERHKIDQHPVHVPQDTNSQSDRQEMSVIIAATALIAGDTKARHWSGKGKAVPVLKLSTTPSTSMGKWGIAPRPRKHISCYLDRWLCGLHSRSESGGGENNLCVSRESSAHPSSASPTLSSHCNLIWTNSIQFNF